MARLRQWQRLQPTETDLDFAAGDAETPEEVLRVLTRCSDSVVQVSRVFGFRGEPYPRISISVTITCHDTWIPPVPPPLMNINCSCKSGPKDWWREYGVPLELVGNIVNMFEEAHRVFVASPVLRERMQLLKAWKPSKPKEPRG